MKKIWVLTLFPNYFAPFKELGVIGQTLQGDRGDSIELNTIQLSEYSPRSFKGVDSAPYGGGPGMVMRADVLKAALLEGVVNAGNYGDSWRENLHVVYTGPRGNMWNNKNCKTFANKFLKEDTTKDIVFICGRYEGIDERFIDLYVNEVISLGDFVLSGGELAVMTIIDSALRFRKGSLGNKNSASEDSFENHLLEHPQYTRPSEFDDVKVPDILMSGHHLNIEKYQKDEKIRITKSLRPDLYKKYKSGQEES
jgi:tRNA (guanine37-N1)-methyltransferase